MIAASWPMPESFVPTVRKESEQDSIVKDTINVLSQKKGQIKDVLSQSEKIMLQDFLNNAIKNLTSKVLTKSVLQSFNFEVLTHDLDDTDTLKSKVPFTQFLKDQLKNENDSTYKQPSLFEGTKFDPSNKFNPTKFIDLYNSLASDEPFQFGKVITGMMTITKEELPPQILSGQFNFSTATYEEIAAIFGVPDEHLHSIEINMDDQFPYNCEVIMKRYLPF